MSFTLSLDDFIISYFTNGPSFQTLPIYIFSMTKKRVKPDMYALSFLMFLTILVLLILSNWMQARAEKRRKGSANEKVFFFSADPAGAAGNARQRLCCG